MGALFGKAFLTFFVALTVFGFFVPLLDLALPRELIANHSWIKPLCLYGIALTFGMLQFTWDYHKRKKAQQDAAANP